MGLQIDSKKREEGFGFDLEGFEYVFYLKGAFLHYYAKYNMNIK